MPLTVSKLLEVLLVPMHLLLMPLHLMLMVLHLLTMLHPLMLADLLLFLHVQVLVLLLVHPSCSSSVHTPL